LAAIVDCASGTAVATGEHAQVGHYTVLIQKRAKVPACIGRLANHLAALVDPASLARVARERAKIPDIKTLVCGGLECARREQGESNQGAVNGVRTANFLACRLKVIPFPET
jgi:hypothetical protein